MCVFFACPCVWVGRSVGVCVCACVRVCGVTVTVRVCVRERESAIASARVHASLEIYHRSSFSHAICAGHRANGIG